MRDVDVAGLVARLKRKIVAAFTERLLYKAAALFLALVLWLSVSFEEPTEQIVAVRFAPQLDSSVVLAGPRPQFSALVIGRAREVFKL